MSSYYEKFTATGEVKCIDEEIPFEIPQGWEWCRLRAICTKFSTGPFGTMVHKSDYADNGIPLVNPTNIKEQQIVAENICKVSSLKYKELSTYILYENDIVLARRGDLSKCAIVNKRQVGWLAGTGSFFLHILNLSLDFFIMLYTSVYAQTYLIGDSVGTTMNNLNQGLLSKMLIPIPPLHEQSRIVNQYRFIIPFIERYTIAHSERKLLDVDLPLRIKKSILQEAIQGKLVSQEKVEGTAEDLLKQIKEEKRRLVKEGKLKKSALNDSVIFKGDDNKYYEKIGNETLDITEQVPFDIPSQWSWARLKELCTICTGATFKKEEAKQNKNGIRVLRGGNILPFHLQLKPDDIYIGEEKVKSNILLKTGDIVTPAVTSLENIGKMARVKEDMQKVTVGGFVFIIRPFYVNTFSQYLLYFMSSPTAIEYMKSITNKSGQAFYNIGKERLATTLIPIPPLYEQERICEKVKNIFSKIKG